MRLFLPRQALFCLLQAKLDQFVCRFRIKAFHRDHNVPGLLDKNRTVRAGVAIQAWLRGIRRQALEARVTRTQPC